MSKSGAAIAAMPPVPAHALNFGAGISMPCVTIADVGMWARIPLLERSAFDAAREDGGRGTETPPLSGGRGGASGRSSVIFPLTRDPVALETLLLAS